MRLGYNTNGFAHHDPIEAIRLLGELGYRSIALTVDHHCLPPGAARTTAQRQEIADELRRFELATVIESGARFLLDPRIKHEPTLVTADDRRRRQRIDFLRYCVELAAELESDAVSLWSGISAADESDDAVLERLAAGLEELLGHADACGVDLAFEPEPDMFIDCCAAFDRLCQWIDSPRLKMTMDIGHLYCQGEMPMVDYIHRYRDRIKNVHLEDMRSARHEHLMFGEGEIHFPPVIEALAEIQYPFGVHVELSRHSHMAPEAARDSFRFLSALIEEATSGSADDSD